MITYFAYKLQQQQTDFGESEVLATIQQGAMQWKKDRLKVIFRLRTMQFDTDENRYSAFSEVSRFEVQIRRRRPTRGIFHSVCVVFSVPGFWYSLEYGQGEALLPRIK